MLISFIIFLYTYTDILLLASQLYFFLNLWFLLVDLLFGLSLCFSIFSDMSDNVAHFYPIQKYHLNINVNIINTPTKRDYQSGLKKSMIQL